jgi:dTMP kinase
MILKNFIVFEGIDGSGTSTQIQMIANTNKIKFAATSEPTKNETGLFLRKMLKGDFSIDERTAAYLFAADRCEHIYGKNGILELLKQGKTVISDRYFFSSLAYQSSVCGKELPRLLNSPFPLPEYLFYFKINPEISLKRVNSRNETKEIYEKLDIQIKTAALYDEVIEEYKKMGTENEMKIITIDASKSIEEVNSEIMKIFSR